MENEFEVILHPQIRYVNIFMVSTEYRNPHLHREIELILLMEGGVRVTTRRESYLAASPSLILMGPNHMHEFALSGESSPMMLVLQVSPKFFECVNPSVGNIVFDRTKLNDELGDERFEAVHAMMAELGYRYFKQDRLYEFACASILHELFGNLIGWLLHRVISDDEKNAECQKAGRISRIISYVDDHFTSKIRLSDISEQENLSMSYLSHFFKENMNQSFNDYVNMLRFNLSKKLLVDNPGMSLTDICLQSGYSDSRYMRRAFVERLGCTPDQYRARQVVDVGESVSKYSSTSEKIFSAEEALQYLTAYRKRRGGYVTLAGRG